MPQSSTEHLAELLASNNADAHDFGTKIQKYIETRDPAIVANIPAQANWNLNRMAVTDRNILRLGAFEILFSDTPGRVAINEAVELAKRFGAKQSPQFVNGILDRLLPNEEKPTGAEGK